MRISDWSSDVCSSDLHEHDEITWEPGYLAGARSPLRGPVLPRRPARPPRLGGDRAHRWPCAQLELAGRRRHRALASGRDRKSVVAGKSVTVRVDLGGRRIIQKKKKHVNEVDEL